MKRSLGEEMQFSVVKNNKQQHVSGRAFVICPSKLFIISL